MWLPSPIAVSIHPAAVLLRPSACRKVGAPGRNLCSSPAAFTVSSDITLTSAPESMQVGRSIPRIPPTLVMT